jgi:hypothetical protein
VISGFEFKSDRFSFKDFRKVAHKSHDSRRSSSG